MKGGSYIAEYLLVDRDQTGKRDYDLWFLNGKTLTITDKGLAGYGPSEVKGDPEAYGPYFKIRYKYASTYDPRFVASI